MISRKTILTAVAACAFLACSNSEKKSTNALAYNEALIKEISKVDSVRAFIGDKEDESIEELNADLLEYQNQVELGLQNIVKLDYKKDTLFKNAVIRHLMLNKGLSEVDYPNMIKLKTKLTDPKANKEEVYALMYAIYENMNSNLEKSIKKVSEVQAFFANKNKITLK